MAFMWGGAAAKGWLGTYITNAGAATSSPGDLHADAVVVLVLVAVVVQAP